MLLKSGSETQLADLCEVLDDSGAPLCLLSPKEVLSQKLLHRSVAALLLNSRGQLYLHCGEKGLDFSAFGILPAFQSPWDFCGHLLADRWNCGGNCGLAGVYPPCAANDNSWTHVFKVHAELYTVPENALAADKMEILALLRRGYAMNSFFCLLLTSGWLNLD